MEKSDVCSSCAGKGHLPYATYSHGDITTVCPMCNGTGKQQPKNASGHTGAG